MSDMRSARDDETGESRPEERATVRKGIFAGLIFISLTFLLGCLIIPPIVFKNIWERVLYTLRFQVLSLGMLLAGVIVVWMRRLGTQAINPLRECGERFVKLDNKYLQNTVEQTILSTMTQLILTSFIEDLWVIPVMTFLFVIGRISFWIGYTWMPLYRSFGFTLTLVPTIFAYVLTLGMFLRNGATHEFVTISKTPASNYGNQQFGFNQHYM